MRVSHLWITTKLLFLQLVFARNGMRLRWMYVKNEWQRPQSSCSKRVIHKHLYIFVCFTYAPPPSLTLTNSIAINGFLTNFRFSHRFKKKKKIPFREVEFSSMLQRLCLSRDKASVWGGEGRNYFSKWEELAFIWSACARARSPPKNGPLRYLYMTNSKKKNMRAFSQAQNSVAGLADDVRKKKEKQNFNPERVDACQHSFFFFFAIVLNVWTVMDNPRGREGGIILVAVFSLSDRVNLNSDQVAYLLPTLRVREVRTGRGSRMSWNYSTTIHCPRTLTVLWGFHFSYHCAPPSDA